MNFVWGGLLVAVGIFLFVSALRKSDFIVYRLLTYRSRILWKENVHRFYQVAGVLVVIFGVIVMTGVVGK